MPTRRRSPSASGACWTSSRATLPRARDAPRARRPRSRRSPVPTTAPPTTRAVIDLGGLTVLPGLIDTHSHLVGEVQTARRARARRPPPRRTRCSACATPGTRSRPGSRRVRDVGTFRAFVDCRAARRDRPRATSRGRGCSAPARSSPRRGAAATSSASRTTSGCPDDLRFGVVTSAGRGPRARPAAADRRRGPDQVHRDRARS